MNQIQIETSPGLGAPALAGYTRRRPILIGAGLLATLLTALLAPAQAALVLGPGGTAEQGRRSVTAAPVEATGAQAGLALAAGLLEAVDAKTQQVRVAGRTVGLHPTGLRVLSAAGINLGGAAALKPGMAVRFALEPEAAVAAQAGQAAGAAPAERRIVLVYVDRQP